MADPKEPEEQATEVVALETKKPELAEEPEAPPDDTNMIVVASNPQQMQKAQHALTVWGQARIDRLNLRVKELEENLAIAKKNRWRSSTIASTLSDLKKEVLYYEKLNAAVAAGYTIIPNFPHIDIFAIRTTKRSPRVRGKIVQQQDYGGSRPTPHAQDSDRSPLGEGRYVDADAKNRLYRWDQKSTTGLSTIPMVKAIPVEFNDVGFPFALAKPQILERTADAMRLLVFDDIGIVPGRRASRRRGDPMVIGRVHRSKHESISFLVTWFINTEDL